MQPTLMIINQNLIIQDNQNKVLLIMYHNTWNLPFSTIQTHENWYTNIKRTIKKQLGLPEIEVISLFDVDATNHEHATIPTYHIFYLCKLPGITILSPRYKHLWISSNTDLEKLSMNAQTKNIIKKVLLESSPQQFPLHSKIWNPYVVKN